MTRAGVPENVIVTHIRNHGAARPLQANDLIVLQQQGISPNVVQALQSAPPPQVGGPPGVVIAQPYPVPPPVYWGPPPYAYYPPPYYYGPYRRPGVHWAVGVGR